MTEPSAGPRPRLDDLPDSARLWIFAFDSELADGAAQDFLREADTFLDGWAAHGVPLRAARSLRYGRFLFVGVDETATPASGCSIDALVRAVQDLAEQAGARLAGNESVWYRVADGEIICVARPAFRKEAMEGRIGGASTVFDNTIGRMTDLRAGKWEAPASDCWHAALLP